MVLPAGYRSPGPKSLGPAPLWHFPRTMATRSPALGRAAPEVRGVASATGPTRPTGLPAYVALAFLISWGWLVPVVLTGGQVEAGAGWPTHVPALVGPMAAALLVSAGTGGRAAVLDLLAPDGACHESPCGGGPWA